MFPGGESILGLLIGSDEKWLVYTGGTYMREIPQKSICWLDETIIMMEYVMGKDCFA